MTIALLFMCARIFIYVIDCAVVLTVGSVKLRYQQDMIGNARMSVEVCNHFKKKPNFDFTIVSC